MINRLKSSLSRIDLSSAVGFFINVVLLAVAIWTLKVAIVTLKGADQASEDAHDIGTAQLHSMTRAVQALNRELVALGTLETTLNAETSVIRLGQAAASKAATDQQARLDEQIKAARRQVNILNSDLEITQRASQHDQENQQRRVKLTFRLYSEADVSNIIWEDLSSNVVHVRKPLDGKTVAIVLLIKNDGDAVLQRPLVTIAYKDSVDVDISPGSLLLIGAPDDVTQTEIRPDQQVQGPYMLRITLTPRDAKSISFIANISGASDNGIPFVANNDIRVLVDKPVPVK